MCHLDLSLCLVLLQNRADLKNITHGVGGNCVKDLFSAANWLPVH